VEGGKKGFRCSSAVKGFQEMCCRQGRLIVKVSFLAEKPTSFPAGEGEGSFKTRQCGHGKAMRGPQGGKKGGGGVSCRDPPNAGEGQGERPKSSGGLGPNGGGKSWGGGGQ